MERFSNEALYHWGIPNQKWGRRRYQYEDGSLTPEGRERYGRGSGRRKRSFGIPDTTVKVGPVKDNIPMIKRAKTKAEIQSMTDEELKAASDRIDMEKSYLDKSLDYDKKVGQKSVPKYMEILNDIKDVTSIVDDISKDVSDVAANVYRIAQPTTWVLKDQRKVDPEEEKKKKQNQGSNNIPSI